MNVLSSLSAFWLNFALHVTLISLAFGILPSLFRDPGKKAFAAACAVVCICVLPWLTATALAPRNDFPPAITSAAGPRMPMWTVRIEQPERSSAPPPSGTGEPKSANFANWPLVVGAVWLAGSLLGSAGVFLRRIRLGRWIHAQLPPTDEQCCQLRPLTGSLLGRNRIRISRRAISPCVAGALLPTLVIPGFLLDPKSSRELKWAVHHEMEHLRSRDPLMGCILELLKSAVWWNPAIWRLCAVWALERERVCDLRAVAGDDERIGYGNFLLDLASSTGMTGKGAIRMAGGRTRRMRERLQTLKGQCTYQDLTWTFRVSVAAIGMIFFVAVSRAQLSAVSPDGVQPEQGKSGIEKVSRPTAAAPVEDVPSSSASAIRISTHLVVTDPTLPIPEGLLDEEAVERFAESLLKDAAEFTSAPVIGLKSGGSTSLGLLLAGDGVESNQQAREAGRFLGLALDISASITGNQSELVMKARFNYLPGKRGIREFIPWEEDQRVDEDMDWKRVLTARLEKTVLLESGQSLFLPLEGYDHDRKLLLLVGATSMNSAGRRTKGFDSNAILHAEMKDRVVILSGAMIKLPRGKAGLGAFDFSPVRPPGLKGQSLVGKRYPAEDFQKMKEAITADDSADWQDLSVTAVPLGSEIAPWPTLENVHIRLGWASAGTRDPDNPEIHATLDVGAEVDASMMWERADSSCFPIRMADLPDGRTQIILLRVDALAY